MRVFAGFAMKYISLVLCLVKLSFIVWFFLAELSPLKRAFLHVIKIHWFNTRGARGSAVFTGFCGFLMWFETWFFVACFSELLRPLKCHFLPWFYSELWTVKHAPTVCRCAGVEAVGDLPVGLPAFMSSAGVVWCSGHLVTEIKQSSKSIQFLLIYWGTVPTSWAGIKTYYFTMNYFLHIHRYLKPCNVVGFNS